MPRLGHELKDEVALVTGASRGIGHAVALELGRCGAFVAGTATTAERADALDDFYREMGIRGMGLQLDLAKPETFEERIGEVVDGADGHITTLINNAGITHDQLAIRMTPEEWDEVIAVNLTGPFRLTQMCLRGMLRAKRGNVVSIGSVVGTVGEAGQVNYAAAKAGLVGMTKSLAKEYGNKGLRFNVVAPGYVDTDMTRALPEDRVQQMLEIIPIGRPYSPQEVAVAVRETLLSDKNGEVVAIDGGLTSENYTRD